MKNKDLFVVGLCAKLGVISLFLMFIFCFNYMFSKDWYKPAASTKELKQKLDTIQGNKPKEVPRIDVRSQIGITPLMSAAATGNTKKVAMLIANGADVNARANNVVKRIALHYSCFNGYVDTSIYLLNKGANFLAYDTNNNPAIPQLYGVNLFSSKVFKRLIQAFADKGANLNLPDKARGMPLLFWVIQRSQYEMVKVLLDDFGHFIDFDFKNKKGKTALQYVQTPPVLIQNLRVIKLLKGIRLRALDGSVNINGYDKKGFTLTMKAALKGYTKRLKQLVARKANLNAKDRAKMGNTALHWTCLYNQPGNAEILVKSGADVLVKNNLGAQPMYYVWGIMDKAQRRKIIKLFMKKGANINAQNKKGDTILTHLAFWGAHKKIQDLLSDFSDFINFRVMNKKKLNALGVARRRKDKVLIKTLEPFYKRTPVSRINVLDNKGYSPLMIAALRDDVDDARYLLANGANINMKGLEGNTALHFALRYQGINVAKLLLGNKRIDATISNNKGNTPLLEVPRILKAKARKNIVKKLLTLGANINEKNKQGQTLIEMAKTKRLTGLLDFLKNNAAKIMQSRINKMLKKQTRQTR